MQVLQFQDARKAACIALLEDLLAKARAGDVTTLAIAYSDATGNTGTAYDCDSYARLVGTVEILKGQILHEYFQE